MANVGPSVLAPHTFQRDRFLSGQRKFTSDVLGVREISPPWAVSDVGLGRAGVDPKDDSSVRPVVEPESPHLLAGRCLIALHAVNRSFATVSLRAAETLQVFHRERAHQAAGFASFADFAQEILGLASRTTRRRLALARTAEVCPALRAAFTEGRLSACKILALRPLSTSHALPFWIELAETIPVRELAARVRVALRTCGAEEVDDLMDEPDTSRVTFAAPIPATLVWEEGIAAARSVLGWNAPVPTCLAAVLAETEGKPPARAVTSAVHGADPVELATDPSALVAGPDMRAGESSAGAVNPGRGGQAVPPGTPPPKSLPPLSPSAVRDVRQTLALVEQELGRLAPHTGKTKGDTTFAGGHPGDRTPASTNPSLETLLAQYESLSGVERNLRLLEGRLLRLIWVHGLHRALGAATLAKFAESFLGLSPRSARALVSETMLFQEEPLLAEAYRLGQLGTTQARLVQRVALTRTLPAHIRRAESVTVRQLEKETRFLQRLADLAPEVWRRHPGPLPDPGLENALLHALARRGADPSAVWAELQSRGLTQDAATGSADPRDALRCTGILPNTKLSDLAQDPAADPVLLTRLEILLDLLVLVAYPDGVDGTPANGFADSRERQTLASRAMTTLTFYASPDLLEAWNSALHRLRAARGPLPTWACAVLLIREALDVWLHTDPETRPAEHAILDRDDYACRAPGCSSRRHLEVHHIRFRSRGGTDDAWNKVTLCHTHHHHAVHAGSLGLGGAAPSGLTWEMGTGAGRTPILVLRGDRILTRH